MPNNKKSFDQIAYQNAYNKEKYTNCTMRIKHEEAEKITEYCKKLGLSRASFFVKSAFYIMENNIDLSE